MPKKGIFCLETDWSNRLDDKLSVEPMLQLLSQHGIPHIHRSVPNRANLKYYLQKRKQKGYADYPILYTACHGENGCIKLSDFREKPVSIEELAELVGGSCKKRIVYFGSCGTVDLSKAQLQKFLSATGAVAVCGYYTDIDWLQSTAMDLLVFDAMQNNVFDLRGAAAMKKRIYENGGSLLKKLEFRMEIRQK